MILTNLFSNLHLVQSIIKVRSSMADRITRIPNPKQTAYLTLSSDLHGLSRRPTLRFDRPLIQFPGVLLPFIVRDNGSLLISDPTLSSAQRTSSRAQAWSPRSRTSSPSGSPRPCAGRGEARDHATHAAPGGVGHHVDPAGVRPPERAGRPHIQPVLDCLLAALPVVDERNVSAGSTASPPPSSPPSSSPSSKPGSESALFEFTLYMLSTEAAIAHRLFLQPRPPSPLRLRIPPHDLPAAEAFAHFLEWDTVTCYATASLGALWLLDLARTKTASVDGWVREVVGKIVIGVVAGPGAMLRTIWGEREDTLVHVSDPVPRKGE